MTDVVDLAQFKAETSDKASDWTPEDALESTLAAIKAGNIAPNTLLILFDNLDDDRAVTHVAAGFTTELEKAGFASMAAHTITVHAIDAMELG